MIFFNSEMNLLNRKKIDDNEIFSIEIKRSKNQWYQGNNLIFVAINEHFPLRQLKNLKKPILIRQEKSPLQQAMRKLK